jgi:anti-anti-sigma factor
MKVTIEEKVNKYVITLEGEMDTAASLEVEEQLQPLYKPDGRDIIFECKGLEYIASSGLRILLTILNGAKASGSKVVMKDVNDVIKNVFNFTGFSTLFTFE